MPIQFVKPVVVVEYNLTMEKWAARNNSSSRMYIYDIGSNLSDLLNKLEAKNLITQDEKHEILERYQ